MFLCLRLYLDPIGWFWNPLSSIQLFLQKVVQFLFIKGSFENHAGFIFIRKKTVELR
jgi:hypothetical protein